MTLPDDHERALFIAPHHPFVDGEFVGERDGGDLGGAPRQQRGKPGPMLRAVDLGIADHRKRARRRPTTLELFDASKIEKL